MASYEINHRIRDNSGITIGHNSGTVIFNPGRTKVETAYFVPDLLSQYFTGRQQELDRLDQLFQSSTTTGPARCIVHGMPGLGKTQFALGFANTKKDRYPFIFWISGASIDKLNSGYSDIHDLVGGDAKTQTARNFATKRWLETQTEQSWLLVVDNVNEETMPIIRDMLPTSNSNGNILITTRFQNVADSLKTTRGERHAAIELARFDHKDAIKLFFAIRDDEHDVSGDVSEYENVKAIVQLVGCLPLAIDQAASLSVAPGQSIRKVLNIYNSPELTNAITWNSESSKHEASSVADCFAPLLAQVHEISPGACDLLCILAFLDPENIPLEIIKEGIQLFKPIQKDSKRSRRSCLTMFSKRSTADIVGRDDLKDLRPIFASAVKVQNMVQTLQNFSIIKVKNDRNNANLWIHDLVCLLIRANLMDDATQRFRWLRTAIGIIHASVALIQDPKDVKNWPRYQKYVPHLQKLRNNLDEQGGTSIHMMEMEGKMAIYLHERGNFDEAILTYERVLANRGQSLGMDQDTLDVMNNLAVSYERQARFEEAMKLTSQVVATRKKRLGKKHKDTLVSMNNLALQYLKLERNGEGEQLLIEVLSLRRETLGDGSADTLATMRYLAYCYSCQGKLIESEKILVEVLGQRREALGPEHPHTLRTMGDLADTYSRLKRFEESEKLFDEVLPLTVKVLGPQHPNTLYHMHNFAKLLHDQGNIQQAVSQMKEVATSRSKVLGSAHPATQKSVELLARWETKQDINTQDAGVLIKEKISIQHVP